MSWLSAKYIINFVVFVTFNSQLYAQMAQKPSANYTWEKTEVKTGIGSLSVIRGKEDFDKLARVYNKGTVNEIPHILFAIDRKKHNKIYYINTPKYEFHLYFINELLGKNYVPSDISINYTDSTRRFIFGTISYQNLVQAYTYEFWEGDLMTPDLLLCAQNTIMESFEDSIIFKTNSVLHEQVAEDVSIHYITQDQLVKSYPYIALNPGNTKGRIHIAESVEDILDVDENDILVLKEVPVSIPLVAGIITERASTLLSHVNILARGMKIPSIYIKDASREMEPYNEKFVELKATVNGYTIKEINETRVEKSKKIKYAVRSDTTVTRLLLLDKIRESDCIYCGAKAANLGTVNAKMKNVLVPDGFSIPFAQYVSFMKRNDIYKAAKSMQRIPGFVEHSEVRRRELAKLRDKIENAEVDSAVSNHWLRYWNTYLGEKSVFVRSSSNAEDLKNFSGAGLFTTIPNVKTADDLENAVKKVWASVYNFDAYESRRQMGIPDSLIMMSVFVQHAVNSEISGVMITKDPYNPLRQDITYIAAKRGLGIKVVEGRRIAEQVMYSGRSKSIQLISRSEEDTELRLASQGGVEEVPVTTQSRVMPDDLIVKLSACGKKIKQLFGGDMDIEWAVSGDRIIILQARPYK